jgi:hypothetical protein
MGLSWAAFQGIILRFAVDFHARLQAFPGFYLMLLVIAGAYGGHAFAVHAGHHSLHTSGHHEC